MPPLVAPTAGQISAVCFCESYLTALALQILKMQNGPTDPPHVAEVG